MRPNLVVAASSADCGLASKGPLVLVRSVAEVALSSAAEVGGGKGLLRGHLDCEAPAYGALTF